MGIGLLQGWEPLRKPKVVWHCAFTAIRRARESTFKTLSNVLLGPILPRLANIPSRLRVTSEAAVDIFRPGFFRKPSSPRGRYGISRWFEITLFLSIAHVFTGMVTAVSVFFWLADVSISHIITITALVSTLVLRLSEEKTVPKDIDTIIERLTLAEGAALPSSREKAERASARGDAGMQDSFHSPMITVYEYVANLKKVSDIREYVDEERELVEKKWAKTFFPFELEGISPSRKQEQETRHE